MSLVFEQQERESTRAFAAFQVYLSLGPERSLSATAARVGKSQRQIEHWSSEHEWVARAQAHTAHLAAVEREAAEAALRVQGVDWAKRQRELREEEWELHEACIRAAKQGLKEFYERDRDKAPIKLGEIAKLVELASKLGRLATGLATEKTEVTGEAGGAIRVELDAALKKIYGRPLPGEVIEVGSAECGASQVRNSEFGVRNADGGEAEITAGGGLPALPQEASHD
ncbi:MAG TPA: hypothetical protein VNZ22_12460 [Bacillota bacterium]|nr:hypothetical protein [Bacillota bacterium]